MSAHYDFHPGAGPCFSALEPGDTFRFIQDHAHTVGPRPRSMDDNEDFVLFRRNVIYLVISRVPAPDPYIGRFVFLWPNGLSYETLL